MTRTGGRAMTGSEQSLTVPSLIGLIWDLIWGAWRWLAIITAWWRAMEDGGA